MGVEVHRDGSVILLVLDPSHSPQQMTQFSDTNTGPGALRLLRKSEASMKARQYQIVAVVGTIDTEPQYQVIITHRHSLSKSIYLVNFIFQQSKVLRGLRIPQDR